MATPVDAEGAIDEARLVRHARELLGRGLNGVTVFGTTGEGPLFSVAERLRAIEAMLAAGIRADQIVLGATAAAPGDTVDLAGAAGRLGLRATLVAPTFFFREVEPAGLFAFFGRLVDRAGADAPPMLLYHIPQVTGVPVPAALVRQLADGYPGRIIGVKDSGTDKAATRRLLGLCPDLTILIGVEVHIPDGMADGASGTICGLANLEPELVVRLVDGDRSALAPIEAWNARFGERPYVPTLKAFLAERYADPEWRHVLPPHVAPSGPAPAAGRPAAAVPA